MRHVCFALQQRNLACVEGLEVASSHLNKGLGISYSHCGLFTAIEVLHCFTSSRTAWLRHTSCSISCILGQVISRGQTCAGRILLLYSAVSYIRGTSKCHAHHHSRLVGEVASTKPSFARCWMHVMCRALLNCSEVTIQRIQATDAMSSPYEPEHWQPPCSSLNRCRHPRKGVYACDLKNPLQITMGRVSGLLPFFDKEWSRARSLHVSESLVRMLMQ